MTDIHEIAQTLRAEEQKEKFASIVNMLYADNTHYHKCGYPGPSRRKDEDPPPEVKGCGYEWAHWRPDNADTSTADYKARHMCPVCGAGPWWVMPPASALEPPRELPQDGDLGIGGIELLIVEMPGDGTSLPMRFTVHDEIQEVKEVNDANEFVQLLRQLSR